MKIKHDKTLVIEVELDASDIGLLQKEIAISSLIEVDSLPIDYVQDSVKIDVKVRLRVDEVKFDHD